MPLGERVMDCRTARLLLEFTDSHPSEIEPSELENLELHLGECTACRSYAESERALEDHIARAMRAVPLTQHQYRYPTFGEVGQFIGCNLVRRTHRIASP